MTNLKEGQRVLEQEAKAILELGQRLNNAFDRAVDVIFSCKGKVIVSGMGKSGHIAGKISSTMSSTGTPSFFMHPSEGGHGDLGVISEGDIIIALSHSGESFEMEYLLSHCIRKNIFLIAITGNKESSLAQSAQIVLNTFVKKEACPMGLSPTTSSTVALALGDALAMSVLKKRGFNEEAYAEFHPSGRLGRRLLTKVKDVMHSGEQVPLVAEDASFKTIIATMTQKDVKGVVGIINNKEELIGIITDGDLRRHLEKGDKPLEAMAKQVMTAKPKTIDANELAIKAQATLEKFKIQNLFVIDKELKNSLKPVGMIHIHDLLPYL